MISDEQRKALIVGISDYTYLQTLDICKNDAAEVYKILSSLGYEISDKNKLLGEAKGERLKDAIYDFFSDIKSNPDDTLLFYYSGHGVPDVDGDIYLASSDIDPNEPYRKGFSFEELTKMIQRSISTKVVVILDSCYSGSAKISKGNEEDAAKVGRITIEEKSRKLQEQGKYILSASQALQEAYALTTGEHSIFTYYILQGLRGDTKSIDSIGNVTPESLGKYAYREIMGLPLDKRPRQKPMTRAEGSANIILASYPELKPLKIEDMLASMLKLLRESKVQEFNKMREESSAILPMPDFSMENLQGVQIAGANLSNANLFRADLEGANLSKTNFSKALLEASNLSNANLTKSNLSNANIFSGDLQQARLIGADLRGTNLKEANQIGADLSGAIFEDRKPLDTNTFAATTTTTKYHQPTTKSSEAATYKGILRSKNKISIAVLAIVIIVVSSLALFNYHNYSSTNNKNILNNKGGALIGHGTYSKDVILYDKDLKIDPSDKGAAINKGRILASLGNYSEAITYFDKALKLDPTDTDALTGKGLSLDYLGNHTEAITYFDKTLKLDPTNKDALAGKGLALDHLGNHTEAITYFDKVLIIDPTDKDALSGKSIALHSLGF